MKNSNKIFITKENALLVAHIAMKANEKHNSKKSNGTGILAINSTGIAYDWQEQVDGSIFDFEVSLHPQRYGPGMFLKIECTSFHLDHRMFDGIAVRNNMSFDLFSETVDSFTKDLRREMKKELRLAKKKEQEAKR